MTKKIIPSENTTWSSDKQLVISSCKVTSLKKKKNGPYIP
jgi:hypothetical protein